MIEEIAENRVVVGSASYDILIKFADINELSKFKTMIDNFARRNDFDIEYDEYYVNPDFVDYLENNLEWIYLS